MGQLGVFIASWLLVSTSTVVLHSALQPNIVATFPRPRVHGTNRSGIRRPKREDSKAVHFHDDVRQLLEKEDYVSAVLHYVELTQNQSESHDCRRASLKSHFKYTLSDHSYAPYAKQAYAALKVSNILNNLFLKASNETEVLYNEALYYSLVTVNVESDPLVLGSTIAFQNGSFLSPIRLLSTLFAPSAFWQEGKVVIKDLAKSNSIPYHTKGSVGNEWFWAHAYQNITHFLLHKYGPEFSQYYSGLLGGAKDLVIRFKDGRWTSPYFDCGGGNTWVVSYSAPFFSRHEDNLIFKGVSMVSINLANVDIDQCSEDEGMFAGTHKCETETTECIPVSGMGFRRGAYKCQCKEGFYFPLSNKSVDYFEGTEIESVFVASLLEDNPRTKENIRYPDSFMCFPCKPGCPSCEDDSPCTIEYNIILRSFVLGLQSFCTTIAVVLLVVVFRLRKSKMISSSLWILLETLLLGAVLLYQTMVLRYFEPTSATCLAEPWFRELGFAMFYGTILLKIYRILAEFQTRKAYRICVRNRDLFKYLLGIVLVVVGYMSAWTAVVVDSTAEGLNVLEKGKTVEGLIFFTCRALWWDYVTELGELGFMCFGIYLTYRIRNAKTDYFREKTVLCAAIYIEVIVSFVIHAIRHSMRFSLGPDFVFFLFFIRCQLTVSGILTVIFGPKLWYHYRPPDPSERPHTRHFSSCDVQDHLPEVMKLHEAIMSNGELDLASISLADMDPEDITAELRRVYTQLQILRNKTMRKDNPHISKRRGGRKVTHRRFSLQAFHKKQHHHDYDHEFTEISKTPEESFASIEGVPIQGDGPSIRTDELIMPAASVSFKSGFK
ncbi:metabotropic glycine receptor-like isoform X2 [Tachypleus tridentatus]|uniref:metabotropic glycine receptor-like isoform X2 n=1 Tax=Tachypleus tridentatus TaxID=6853 RepID=UPI003FD06872